MIEALHTPDGRHVPLVTLKQVGWGKVPSLGTTGLVLDFMDTERRSRALGLVVPDVAADLVVLVDKLATRCWPSAYPPARAHRVLHAMRPTTEGPES